MDYKKIGLFISQERKAKNLTQASLAQKLYVSEKTISKWENGNGLPETGLLLKICDIFEISVNELLSGERLDNQRYKDKAEDNITNLLLQKKNNKQKILFSAICCILSCSVLLVCITLASFLDIAIWLRISLIIYGAIIFVFGLTVAIIYDINIGSFECKYCGKKFAPSTKEYVFAYHSFTKRRLKCPHCGKIGMCKKSLQNKDNN
ncbi:MAG: helix-turn-helix domain-containing protein [Clostridia bacterium]|nr:helix-turn-helix domain-containing protein [Clostridia bacterium]MDE7328535.1 helix-turn-helix domain-containing protein [Clostridia bacterium]